MTTAIDINTNENISIKPIAIYQSDAFDVLLLADANTGKGIWRGFDYQWYTDPEDGDLDHDADKIEDVYGADEEECILLLPNTSEPPAARQRKPGIRKPGRHIGRRTEFDGRHREFRRHKQDRRRKFQFKPLRHPQNPRTFDIEERQYPILVKIVVYML